MKIKFRKPNINEWGIYLMLSGIASLISGISLGIVLVIIGQIIWFIELDREGV